MSTFPSIEVPAETHLVEIDLNGRIGHGQVDLRGSHLPEFVVTEDIEVIDESSSHIVHFPSNHSIPRLVGQLATNQDIVFIDSVVSNWFMKRSIGHGRYAIAGLRVASVPDDRYRHIRFQATGSDVLFGATPLKNVSFPKEGAEPETPYSAILNDKSRRTWTIDDGSVEISCGYDMQFSFSDFYRYELKFGPVVDIYCEQGLNVDEWLSDWIHPFLNMASLATKRPQRLSWLTVRTPLGDSDVSGVVFAGNIAQEPYEAEVPRELWEENRRPLFTLAKLRIALPELLRRWKILQASDNPFFELSQLALNQADLPSRARFLYLVQALEALHGYENKAKDIASQEKHLARRELIIHEVEVSGLISTSVSFIRKYLSKVKPSALSTRLKQIVLQLPSPVQSHLVSPEMSVIGNELAAAGVETYEAQIERIRNNLSHGNCSYAERDLRAWVVSLELVSRANLLRLLGFDEAEITQSLFPDPERATAPNE